MSFLFYPRKSGSDHCTNATRVGTTPNTCVSTFSQRRTTTMKKHNRTLVLAAERDHRLGHAAHGFPCQCGSGRR